MSSLWAFTNHTKSVTFEASVQSLNVQNEQPCQLAILTARIFADADAYTFDEHDVISLAFNASDIFYGEVSRYTSEDAVRSDSPRIWTLTARDLTARLAWDYIDGDITETETVTERVTRIMGYSTQGFDLSGIDSISDSIGPLASSDGMSVQEALDATATEVGASFYVDWTTSPATFRFFVTPPAGAAPFDLRSALSGSWTSADPPFTRFKADRDAEPQATAIYVKGTGVAKLYGSATTPTIVKTINDPTIVTLDQAASIAAAELNRVENPVVKVMATLHQPGLLPMQTITVDHPKHNVSGSYVVQSTAIRYVSNTRLEMDVVLLDHFVSCHARQPSATSLARGGTDPGTTTSDCGTPVLLPSDMYQDLSLESGGGEQIFVHDPDAGKTAKYSLDLAIRRWYEAAGGGDKYISHQPGTYVPACYGDKAYRRDNGALKWDKSSVYTPKGHQTQDRKKFWVGIDGTPGGSGLPETGYGDFSVDFGPVASPVIVWRGYVTSVPSSGYPLDVTVTGGGSHQVYCGATTNYPYNGVAYGMIMVTDPSWTDSGTPPTEADVAALWDPATSFGLPYMYPGGGPVGPWPFGAYANASDGSFPKWADVPHSSGVPPYTEFPVNQWIVLYVAAERTDYAGAGHPGAIGTTGARFDFTVAGTLGLMSETPTTTPPYLSVRNTEDGSLYNRLELDYVVGSLRRTPAGQDVFAEVDADTIKRYDRSPALQSTVTIAGFFPCDEWTVDDAYNIYRLDSGTLTKYDPGGAVLATADLATRESYLFPSLVTVDTGGAVMIATDFVRVVGYLGAADWTASHSKGVLLLLDKARLDTKDIRYFEGGASDNAQAEAVHHHADGDIYVAGAAQGSEIDGVTLTALSGWVEKVCPTLTDTGPSGTPVVTGDLATVATTGDHQDLTNRDASSEHPAASVTYDHTTSGLTATDVQAAIDELEAGGGGGGASLSDNTPIVESGAGSAGTGTEASRDDHVHPAAGGGGGGGGGLAVFSDGSDGSAHLNGTNTYGWCSLSGSSYTMTQDVSLTDLTVDSGITLKTDGYRIYGTGTLSNAGTITRRTGLDASGRTGGASTVESSRPLGQSTTGGTGGNGAQNGTTGGNNSSNITAGGTGGHGGAGVGYTGGAGGNATLNIGQGSARAPVTALTGVLVSINGAQGVRGGQGGGGGGGATGGQGGGGGGGGGVILIAFETITNTGTITAAGGAGANATTTGGGGGGGGGGVLWLTYDSLTNSGTITAAGGAHGNGAGGGADGTDGVDGVLVYNANA